jgi:hypothetical protein
VASIRPHAPAALACLILVAGPLVLLGDMGFAVWIGSCGLALFACVRLLGAGLREAVVLCAIGSLLATFALRSMPRPPEPRAAFRAVAGAAAPASGSSVSALRAP